MSSVSKPIDGGRLQSIPHRRASKPVVVLKFGGTAVGATRDEGRIKQAKLTIRELIDDGHYVVPVFSAYRRGRSGSPDKVSITDWLQSYASIIHGAPKFDEGVSTFRKGLIEPHMEMIRDLKLGHDDALIADIRANIDRLTATAAMICRARERIPSLADYLVTGGERLAIHILSAYFNDQNRAKNFPVTAAPVTALEMGLNTDNRFGGANIRFETAIEHAREVLIGRYLEQNIMPVVSGFDGIYDPDEEFEGLMKRDRLEHSDREHGTFYRTSLGRGGSDLTATFLGLALDAKYVGFAKDTPGVLTCDDMIVGDSARTIHLLDYDLATEAGNIYSKAVEPVRAGSVPVHIFNPEHPEPFTEIRDADLPAGMYLISRPEASVNVHVRRVSDEPGGLNDFLEPIAAAGVDVAEVRHQRSGTDCIIHGSDEHVQKALDALDAEGFQPQPTYIWYIRVVGNITAEIASHFNAFVEQHHALAHASYQAGTKALTAAFHRNRVGSPAQERNRIEGIVKAIHDDLVVPSLTEIGAADTNVPKAEAT